MNNILSYQVNLLVEPNWRRIAMWYFHELKTEEEAGEYMSKLRNKHKIDKDRSLYLKQFSFVEFYDAVSGLNPIWFDQLKSFTSHLEVRGWLLIDEEGKLEDNLISKDKDGNERSICLAVSPHGIITGDGEMISAIPYDDIINLFVQIQKETGQAHREVKKFPENFRKAFDKNNISYEADFHIYTRPDPSAELIKLESTWFKGSGVELSEQTVEHHVFKTPYYSISFEIRFFSPGNARPETSDLSVLPNR